jgi:cytochrome P450
LVEIVGDHRQALPAAAFAMMTSSIMWSPNGLTGFGLRTSTLPIFGPDSILLSNGEEPLAKRRRLRAVFREKDIERSGATVEEIAVRHIVGQRSRFAGVRSADPPQRPAAGRPASRLGARPLVVE